jgi:hypothetical protein
MAVLPPTDETRYAPIASSERGGRCVTYNGTYYASCRRGHRDCVAIEMHGLLAALSQCFSQIIVPDQPLPRVGPIFR